MSTLARLCRTGLISQLGCLGARWIGLAAIVWLAPHAIVARSGEPTDTNSKPPAAGRNEQAPTSQAPTSQTATNQANVEQVTLDFVREHQPELAKLLEFLKARQSPEYQQAIDESYKVRNRLRTIKDRDAELYEVELAMWKNSAKMRLWAATVSVKNKKLSQEDLASLQNFVTREHELSIKRLEIEKARAEARMAQVSQQLSKRQEQSESLIAKGVKTWENRIERAQNKSKSKSTNTKP